MNKKYSTAMPKTAARIMRGDFNAEGGRVFCDRMSMKDLGRNDVDERHTESINIKICFAASTGGHFEQIMMLKPLMEKYESFLITEKTLYDIHVENIKMYYLKQVNRKEKAFFFRMLYNLFESVKIYHKEKPDLVICTGVLAMIPICLIAKFRGKKLIYIESFAKVDSPTRTGKLMYRFADEFYVQWEQMLEIFPKAICLGGIY